MSNNNKPHSNNSNTRKNSRDDKYCAQEPLPRAAPPRHLVINGSNGKTTIHQCNDQKKSS